MKPLSVIIVGVLLVVSVAPQTAGGWSIAPSEETGHYWMYDDAEDGPPFDYPIIEDLDDLEFWDISNTGHKMVPPLLEPYKYTLPDSFWYFGYWYEPGDHFYISWDGWVSFESSIDSNCHYPPETDPAFPNPDFPNEIIASLWQDNDPTEWLYYLHDAASNALIVEWYEVPAHGSGNTYTFEVMLQLGGQELLHIEHDPDRVVFSEHFIHFLYQTSSAGWGADNLHDPPAVGLENQDGTKGIYYQGELADGRVIRMGYKLSDESIEEDSEVVSGFELKAVTEGRDCRVEFSVPYSSRVKLNVFDAGGRLVKCLVDAVFESGAHCLRWDGHEVSSGAYFIRMQAGGYQSVSKAVLIR